MDLSTVENDEPRDSPVWFIWENSFLWIFGTDQDSAWTRINSQMPPRLGRSF